MDEASFFNVAHSKFMFVFKIGDLRYIIASFRILIEAFVSFTFKMLRFNGIASVGFLLKDHSWSMVDSFEFYFISVLDKIDLNRKIPNIWVQKNVFEFYFHLTLLNQNPTWIVVIRIHHDVCRIHHAWCLTISPFQVCPLWHTKKKQKIRCKRR